MQGTWVYIEVEPSKWVGTSTRHKNVPNANSATIALPDSSKELSKNSKETSSSKGE